MENGRRLVLIVDGDKDFVGRVSDILESRGHTVETALSANGAQAKIRVLEAQAAVIDI